MKKTLNTILKAVRWLLVSAFTDDNPDLIEDADKAKTRNALKRLRNGEKEVTFHLENGVQVTISYLHEDLRILDSSQLN